MLINAVFCRIVYELIADFTRYFDISILRNSCADVRVTDGQTAN